MALEISTKEVNDLDPIQFVDLMNHLIAAECDKLGVSPTKVMINCRQYDPDSGIDARVEDYQSRADNRWISTGLSVWQFKAGGKSSEPGQLRREATKPGVAKALQSGGRYVVAIARDCSDRQRKAREKALRETIKRRHLDPDCVTLLTASQLQKWASEHPSILLLPHFHRPTGGWMRFEDWRRNNLHQGRFITDNLRTKIIADIRLFSAMRSSPIHKRVLGRRGVGKTRLVMEALDAEGIRERVIYAQEPDDVPREFWVWMRSNIASSAILVMDECNEDESSKFAVQAETCDGRIRLVTIGIGEPFLSGSSPTHLFLERLDCQSMKEMLRDRLKGLSEEQLAWIVRFTGGYPKLAVVCGRLVETRREIDITQLMQATEIHEILRIFLPDEKERRVMQAVSLLSRVGFEGEVIDEAKVLASFAQAQWSEFCNIVEGMHQQGLVGKKGRYRYVTPDLLACWLATSVWNSRTEEVRELINRLPTTESREAFYERLKDLGTDEKAKATICDLLSERVFPTIEELDSEEGSRLLYTLAYAHPSGALATLERVFDNVSIDRLRSLRKGRRNVVNALNYLKWFKRTFFGAARLLLALAEAENEDLGNNATGIWTSLFQLGLGGTEVPALDRLSLLEEVLSGDSPVRKDLALKALSSLMSYHEIRTSGYEEGGARPVPSEWRPRVFGEIWEVHRKALQIVDQAIRDRDSSIVLKARTTLLRSARTVVATGLAQEIVCRLEEFSPQSDGERREASDTVRMILEYESDKLKEDQRNQLMAIEQKLAGTSFHDRLRRWVGQWSFGDWDIHRREGGPPPQDRAAALAEEVMEEPELLLADIDWLFSNEAQNVVPFAERLGKLDEDWSWLPNLVAKTRQGGRPLVLAGYFWGRAHAGDDQRVRDHLNQWASNDKQLAPVVLAATFNLRASQENLDRILILIEKEWLARRELASLSWTGWSDKLPLHAFETFLRHILDRDPEVTRSGINALDRRLKLYPNEKERLAEFAWALLERDTVVEGTMAEYYWHELSKHYVERDPLRIAEIVLKTLETPKFLLRKDSAQMKALAQATVLKPRDIWNLVAEALLRKDDRSYRLQLSLESWYVELLPIEQLLDWARRCTPEGPRILAALTSPSGVPLATLPRQLLIQFGDDEQVGRSLHGNAFSGGVGFHATDLQGKLDAAKSWLDDTDAKVRRWAEGVVTDLQKLLQKWTSQLEESGLL